MTCPPIPPDETQRVATLHDLRVIDTPIEERFERITRLARRLLGVPIAAISLLDTDRQWFKSVQGLDVTETSREVSFCGHTILSDDLNIVPDASQDPRFADNPLVTGEPHISFYAGCPLKAANGSRIGSLCIIDRKPRRLSRDDRQVLLDLAGLAETELRESMGGQVQLDLLAQLTAERRQSMIDPLTRLWNRDGLFDLLDRQLAKVKEGTTSLGVLMVDLDFFKKVNDQYGHLAGDEVLRQAARRMLGSLRQDDIVARFGGEEFVVIIADAGCQMTALRIAERLRLRISDGPIRVNEFAVPVTASVGLAYVPSTSQASIDAILNAADGALLQAKRTGRDRLICADNLDNGPTPIAQAG